MLRSLTLGCVCGLVLVLGFVVWRALHAHEPGATALGFAAGALGMAAIATPLTLWWLRRSTRRATEMPADAELASRGRWNWWFVLGGMFIAVNALVRGLDDDAAFAGVLTGMVLGGALAFGLGLRWLSAWEAEHGRELLQWRRRGFKKTEYRFRDLHRAGSHRFTRERETVGTR